MDSSPLCVSRRALVLGLVGLGVGAGRTLAQAPEPVVEVLGRGRTDFAEAVGGPAELVAAKVTLPPGAVIPWHTHPGPVQGVMTAGALTVYGADGCKAVYGAGAAVFIASGTTHEERNEGSQPLELVANYVVPEGAPLRLPAAAPA